MRLLVVILAITIAVVVWAIYAGGPLGPLVVYPFLMIFLTVGLVAYAAVKRRR
jgi:hypothetical protein